MTVLFLLSYDCLDFLIHSSDFNVCTDGARMFLIYQVKEKEKNVVLKMLL